MSLSVDSEMTISASYSYRGPDDCVSIMSPVNWGEGVRWEGGETYATHSCLQKTLGQRHNALWNAFVSVCANKLSSVAMAV